MFNQPLQKISVIAISIIILSACSMSNKPELIEQEPSNSFNIRTSLWLVDWSYEKSVKEANDAVENIDNILLFATYFDESGELYQTENTIRLIEEVVENPTFNEKNIYMTIVNDQFK